VKIAVAKRRACLALHSYHGKAEQIYFEPPDEMFDRIAKRGRESERTFRSRASRGLHMRFYGNPVGQEEVTIFN